MDGGTGPTEDKIQQLSLNPPGFDSEDPYQDVNLRELPRWWREAVEEFRKHGMRPYRPPRFEDGSLQPPVLNELESELAIDIEFMKFADRTEKWTVLLDGTPIIDVSHHRAPEGFSVFQIDRDSFERTVRNHADQARNKE